MELLAGIVIGAVGMLVFVLVVGLAGAAGKKAPDPVPKWLSRRCCYRPYESPHADYCPTRAGAWATPENVERAETDLVYDPHTATSHEIKAVMDGEAEIARGEYVTLEELEQEQVL